MIDLYGILNILENAGEQLRYYMDANGGTEGIRAVAEQLLSADPDNHAAISAFTTPEDIANGITGRQANSLGEYGMAMLRRQGITHTATRTERLSFLSSNADAIEALALVNEALRDYDRRVEGRIGQLQRERAQRVAEEAARRAELEPRALLERLAELEAKVGISTE